jgi:outer membrane lipoprotein-sorting protein
MCRCRLLAALCLFIAAAHQGQSAPGWGLASLMQSLAHVRAASAKFTERQSSPVLSAPLVSTGTLTYAAPDYLRKATISPVPEIFVLDHDHVTMTGGADGGIHEFALSDDPRIAGLVEGIRATLAGDMPALQRFYTVSLNGDAAGWQLRLSPKDPALAHFVRSIVISGNQDRIGNIDTASSDGGDSSMSIRVDDVTVAP